MRPAPLRSFRLYDLPAQTERDFISPPFSSREISEKIMLFFFFSTEITRPDEVSPARKNNNAPGVERSHKGPRVSVTRILLGRLLFPKRNAKRN